MAANDQGSKLGKCSRRLICQSTQADHSLAGVLGLMLGLAWIFFSLRIYVRAFITKLFRVDDLFLIASIVSSYRTLSASLSNVIVDILYNILYM
jgi:hypothetical protein